MRSEILEARFSPSARDPDNLNRYLNLSRATIKPSPETGLGTWQFLTVTLKKNQRKQSEQNETKFARFFWLWLREWAGQAD